MVGITLGSGPASVSISRRVVASWQRLNGPFREFGLPAGAIYIADRLVRRVLPRSGIFFYEFMAQPVPAAPLLPERLARNLEPRIIGPGHPDVQRMPAREDIKAQRFEQGAWCVGTYKNDQLLGYVWFCAPQYEEDEVRCTYILSDAGAGAFDFDLYVMPERRMGLAFSALWHTAFQHLSHRGVRYSFSRMTRFNLPSRNAHLRLGSQRVGRALFLQSGVVEFMVSSLAPYVALTWSRNQRVGLRLHPPAAGTTRATGPAGSGRPTKATHD